MNQKARNHRSKSRGKNQNNNNNNTNNNQNNSNSNNSNHSKNYQNNPIGMGGNNNQNTNNTHNHQNKNSGNHQNRNYGKSKSRDRKSMKNNNNSGNNNNSSNSNNNNSNNQNNHNNLQNHYYNKTPANFNSVHKLGPNYPNQKNFSNPHTLGLTSSLPDKKDPSAQILASSGKNWMGEVENYHNRKEMMKRIGDSPMKSYTSRNGPDVLKRYANGNCSPEELVGEVCTIIFNDCNLARPLSLTLSQIVISEREQYGPNGSRCLPVLLKTLQTCYTELSSYKSLPLERWLAIVALLGWLERSIHAKIQVPGAKKLDLLKIL